MRYWVPRGKVGQRNSTRKGLGIEDLSTAEHRTPVVALNGSLFSREDGSLQVTSPKASKILAMASNLIAMASNLIAMASNLIAMASNLSLKTNSDGLKPNSDGLQPTTLAMASNLLL